ncbi:MAG: long-chain fatty acid--CoA ligase, partial [Candidatus Thermoplasmatota archaeon]|nr:long-chain fatty acid--CoA ligase [Candidatus Thermoplasmatota archaeon]
EIFEEINSQINSLNSRFSNPEQVKKVTILPRDFDIDNSEMTPTLKIRRKQINENWAKEIEAMYAE